MVKEECSHDRIPLFSKEYTRKSPPPLPHPRSYLMASVKVEKAVLDQRTEKQRANATMSDWMGMTIETEET